MTAHTELGSPGKSATAVVSPAAEATRRKTRREPLSRDEAEGFDDGFDDGIATAPAEFMRSRPLLVAKASRNLRRAFTSSAAYLDGFPPTL